MTTNEVRSYEPSNGKTRRAPAKESLFAGYYAESEEQIPLGGYAAIVGAFGVFAAVQTMVLFRSKHKLPSRPALSDLFLLGVATHKLARLITKDWVTGPLRAAFTKYSADEGGGEVTDLPRGSGLRNALGALATCPWCIAPWIALPFSVGAVVCPRAARFIAGVLATIAISDTLQHLYLKTKQLGAPVKP